MNIKVKVGSQGYSEFGYKLRRCVYTSKDNGPWEFAGELDESAITALGLNEEANGQDSTEKQNFKSGVFLS